MVNYKNRTLFDTEQVPVSDIVLGDWFWDGEDLYMRIKSDTMGTHKKGVILSSPTYPAGTSRYFEPDHEVQCVNACVIL